MCLTLPSMLLPQRCQRCHHPLCLQEHAANPAEGWRAKDCAVYLVMAVTIKGRTGAQGATTTNRLVNIDDFFKSQVGCL